MRGNFHVRFGKGVYPSQVRIFNHNFKPVNRIAQVALEVKYRTYKPLLASKLYIIGFIYDGLLYSSSLQP